MPKFILGFAALADMIPDIVGEPKENEHHNAQNGDGLQATTNGLLVWRKADNFTAFTDGYQTWVNGPHGLQQRLNSERFDWEQRPAPYKPQILYMPTASSTFPFLRTPKGFALHGTRSGVSRPASIEFPAAASYGQTRTDDLSANCTIGNDAVALHIPWDQWGWHARRASMYYVSLEIAQGTVNDPVTDAQVRTIAWIVRQVREVWPDIPLHFPTHAELEAWGETGYRDGKTDVFEFGSPRADELRSRIMQNI